jgi:hypothetical protein
MNSLKGTLRKSMFLWLNPMPEDNLEELIMHFNQVRTALDLMLDGKISWDDYLDIAEACGVDIDSYLTTYEENLIILA